MIGAVTDPADLGVVEASEALHARAFSSRELVEACLARIRRAGRRTQPRRRPRLDQRLGACLRGGRARCGGERGRAARRRRCTRALRHPDRAEGPVRRRRQAADRVERRARRGARPRLRRVGAASAEGMVLLGHLHTHEFACGGTTDQVGNPWALERSAGGSSGGSAAALASRQVSAATGTDTAGSLRIPSAECGTSTVKPTRGLVPLRGIVPLSPTFDHAGPMARTVRDCEPLLAALAGVDPAARARRPPPLRTLSADRGARPGRRRRVRARARGASRRARRAAAPGGPPGCRSASSSTSC